MREIIAWLNRLADEHLPHPCDCGHWVWGINNAKRTIHRAHGITLLCPGCYEELYGK